MRVTIIPEDRTVVVNGVAHALPSLPPVASDVHAIQFYPETGHATIEKKAGERDHLAGQVALDLVKPFVDAHAMRAAALKAKANADEAERAAAEQAESDRVAKIKADFEDQQKAAEARGGANKAAEAEAAAKMAAAQPKGNAASNGTQVI